VLEPEPLEPDDAADAKQAPVREPGERRRGPQVLGALGAERDELRGDEDRGGEGEEGDSRDAGERARRRVEERVGEEAGEEASGKVEDAEEGDEARLEEGDRIGRGGGREVRDGLALGAARARERTTVPRLLMSARARSSAPDEQPRPAR